MKRGDSPQPAVRSLSLSSLNHSTRRHTKTFCILIGILFVCLFSPYSLKFPLGDDPVIDPSQVPPSPSPSPAPAPAPAPAAAAQAPAPPPPPPPPATTSLPPIPRKIWQIWIGESDREAQETESFDVGKNLKSWITLNHDHIYTLLSGDGGLDFLKYYYGDQPDIINMYESAAGSPIIRADFLRFLLLAAEGGVYTDLDTLALKPIDDWIPADFREKTRAVVGIEYDQHEGDSLGEMTLPLQFGMWTLMSSPNHPLMLAMAEQMAQNLRKLIRVHGSTLTNAQISDKEVGETTGPVVWSRVVLELLSEAAGEEVTHKTLTGLSSPRLIGDILVLPINWMASGQQHSGSVPDGTPDSLLRHYWKGSWKHDNKDKKGQ